MIHTKSIFTTIKTYSNELKSLGVSRLGIFGSYARGTATKSSDLDILFEFKTGKKTYKNFMGTTSLLEQILNCSIDPITPSSMSPHLKETIEKEIQYVQI